MKIPGCGPRCASCHPPQCCTVAGKAFKKVPSSEGVAQNDSGRGAPEWVRPLHHSPTPGLTALPLPGIHPPFSFSPRIPALLGSPPTIPLALARCQSNPGGAGLLPSLAAHRHSCPGTEGVTSAYLSPRPVALQEADKRPLNTPWVPSEVEIERSRPR